MPSPKPGRQDIERLGVRITRLEPVNLAAISEYEEESKRKEYLDAQYEDLTEALETLEGGDCQDRPQDPYALQGHL